MAQKIKSAQKSEISFLEHFCQEEHARGIERMRTIVSVLWPLYKKELEKIQ